MRAREVLLKKIKFKLLTLALLLFLNNSAMADITNIEKIISHLDKLENCTVSFIQTSENEISEGDIFIGPDRIRIEYYLPTKILLILDDDKAMYYNYELNEDEFFNPQNTSAQFFLEIFKNPSFFLDAKTKNEENYILIEKEIVNDTDVFVLKLFFEDKPLVFRKIELLGQDTTLSMSFLGHKYNESFGKDFFRLINPNFFN